MLVAVERAEARRLVRKLVWLSWLGIVLQSEGLLVQFPVRAHAWVMGSVPSGGLNERHPINVSHISVSLTLSPSLPLSVKINKIKEACKGSTAPQLSGRRKQA